MTELGFSFEISRCSGCMACIVACQDENDLPGGGLFFRHVTKLEDGRYPSVRILFVSLACLHCGNAPCLVACPTGAIYKRKEDGIVDLSQDLCIGCRCCAIACPFGAPQFPDNGKMMKCHLCYHRIERDLEPACVRACPTGALGFGPLEELAQDKAEKASQTLLGFFSLHSEPSAQKIRVP